MEQEKVLKFFRNECNEAEAKEVSAYFEAHPEELNTWLPNEAWEAYIPVVAPSPQESDKMLAAIEKGIRPPAVIHHFRKWSVAAAVAAAVCLLVAGMVLLQQHGAQPPAIAVQPVAAPVQNQWTVRSNTTRKPVTLTLEDSSRITLAVNTVIRYHQPFAHNKREVYLQGAAVFSVHANPQRPFTVYGGGITTTAIGTVFSVRAYNYEKQATVQLLSGKAIISPDQGIASAFRPVQLHPGEELSYQRNALLADVHAIPSPQNTWAKGPNTLLKGDSILFNNESLSNIIRTLKAGYGINIQLDKGAAADIWFTGRFNRRNDSVASILETITSLNDMEMKRTSDGFKIGR